MLRTIFVCLIMLVGACYALQGPFYALLFYLWYAYFRPEGWLWNPWDEILTSFRVSDKIGTYLVVLTLFAGYRFPLNFALVVQGAFLVHCGVSALAADFPDYCWLYFKDFFRVSIIAYFIVVLTTDARRLRLLLTIACLSIGFEGAKQGWVQLIANPGGRNDNIVPFLGDNNGVAVGMLMLAPMLFALGQAAKAKKWRWMFRFLGVGTVYRALTTYSRGGFLAAGALAVVYWFRSKRKVPVLFGTLAAAIIVLPVMPTEFWERMGTIQTARETEDASALGRLHYWTVGVRMAREHPVFGVGFNGYNPSYNLYDFTEGQYGEQRSVHSIWFGVLSETGVIGLLLYVALIALCWRNLLLVRRATLANAEKRDLFPFGLALEAALVVFLVGGTFLPLQYNEMFFHFLALTSAVRRVAEAPVETATAPATTPLVPQAEAVSAGINAESAAPR